MIVGVTKISRFFFLVFEDSLREQVIQELKANRALLCDAAQQAALAKLLITPDFRVNAACVGQPPAA